MIPYDGCWGAGAIHDQQSVGQVWQMTFAPPAPGSAIARQLVAHVKDSSFEWIGGDVARVMGAPAVGVAHIAGPGGYGAFVVENTRFSAR